MDFPFSYPNSKETGTLRSWHLGPQYSYNDYLKPSLLTVPNSHSGSNSTRVSSFPTRLPLRGITWQPEGGPKSQHSPGNATVGQQALLWPPCKHAFVSRDCYNQLAMLMFRFCNPVYFPVKSSIWKPPYSWTWTIKTLILPKYSADLLNPHL